MRGFNQHGCQEPRERVLLAQPRDPRAGWVHTAEAVEDQGVHRRARGHAPRCGLGSGGSVHDLATAECSEPRRHKAPMLEDWTPRGRWPGVLRSRRAFYRPLKRHHLTRDTAECRLEQCQLMSQPVFALTQRADSSSDRRDMLADVEIEALHESRVDVPAARRSHLLDGFQGAEHHAVPYPHQAPPGARS